MTDDYIVSDLSSFRGDGTKVGVGYKFSGVEVGEISISAGDVAVFDDPDAGLHVGGCELINSCMTVAYIDTVYAVDYSHSDYDGYAVEVGTKGPVGRLGITDRHVGIVTEDGVISGLNESIVQREAGRLVDSDDAERYIVTEHHLGEPGTPEGLWSEYDESDRSGPGCPYCTGEEGQGGTRIEIE